MDKQGTIFSLIQDTQENARFIESKTGIIAAIIGAILVYYIQDIKNIIKHFDSFSGSNYAFFFLVILSTLLNVYFLFKIIFPISNPVAKIAKKYMAYPNIYLTRSKINVKNKDVAALTDILCNKNKLEQALELEYVKISHIRNSKLLLYKALVIGLFLQVSFFVAHLIIYNKEILQLGAD